MPACSSRASASPGRYQLRKATKTEVSCPSPEHHPFGSCPWASCSRRQRSPGSTMGLWPCVRWGWLCARSARPVRFFMNTQQGLSIGLGPHCPELNCNPEHPSQGVTCCPLMLFSQQPLVDALGVSHSGSYCWADPSSRVEIGGKGRQCLPPVKALLSEDGKLGSLGWWSRTTECPNAISRSHGRWRALQKVSGPPAC